MNNPARLFALTLPLLLLATAGCRTTRDADDEEMGEINSLGAGVQVSTTVGSDSGQGAVGANAGMYSLLMSLSEKPDNSPAGSSALYLTARDSGPGGPRAPELLAATAAFLPSEARDAWPDCVVQGTNSVQYNACELSASVQGAGFSFLVDGSYDYTDNTADADLTYDLAVGASGVSVDWTFSWLMGLEWTDTTLDGDFGIDYAYGISLGGSPAIGGVAFDATGTYEALTWDGVCAGPVSGIFDWQSTLREGTDPPQNSNVTIEWTACDTATITQ